MSDLVYPRLIAPEQCQSCYAARGKPHSMGCYAGQLERDLEAARISISDSKPKWRDADRDPPADGQKVLACWHGSSCIEGMETLIYRAADEPGGSERWLDVWSDMRDPPTHWTVLPEAP